MKSIFVVAALLFVAGCFTSGEKNSSGNQSPDGGIVPPTFATTGRATPYQPCEATSQCEGDQECIDLLGSKVCTVRGCADGVPCPGDGICVASPALDPSGICANVGGDPTCGSQCRDLLSCNLKPACVENGCCGNLNDAGCPAVCEQLDRLECEVSPQCPIRCCQ